MSQQVPICASARVLSTTLPAGTDTQAFCYDEQNRLTWASAATEAPPCGGTLSSARCVSPE
jgi:hypothetical protein